MNKKKLAFAFSIGMIALTAACTKTGSTGPAGPSYVGDISGHVSLYDQYGTKVTTNLTTVQIQLNGGTAINPNTLGYYIYSKTATGVYYMTVTNSGFAATRENNFQFLSDTLNKDIKLSAIPDFTPLTINSYSAMQTPGDSLAVTFSADTRARDCIFFINNTSTVGSVPANYLLVYTKTIAANQTKAYIIVPANDLYDQGITSGSTVYCAAYGYVVGDVSVYEDVSTGKNVYNAVSTSAVTTTAIVP